jgi:peptide/nickel transport system permease protein
MIPTLIGITLVTYGIVRLAPGDPIEAMIRNQSGNIDPKVMREDAERIRERLGLIDYHFLRDRFFGKEEKGGPPAGRGFGYGAAVVLDRFASIGLGYGRWIRHLAVGDFGESIKYRTSSGSRNPLALIVERIPVTATLNIIAEVLIFFIAIPIGLVAARRQGGVFDRVSSFVILVLWSIPAVLAGTLLIGFLGAGGRGWPLFPIAGLHSMDYETFGFRRYVTDLLWHAALPVLCMTYGGLAYLAKLGRASLLENLRADYVRTARAKGLPERLVVYHHALRNSLLPMITVMVLTLPGLIGGSVIVETIFSIQGTGLLLVGAAQAYDLALIMAETLLYGVLTLVFLLIGDVLYAWADPRIRYE